MKQAQFKITVLKVGYQYGSMHRHVVYTNGLGEVKKVVLCPKPVVVLCAQANARTIKYFKAAVYA